MFVHWRNGPVRQRRHLRTTREPNRDGGEITEGNSKDESYVEISVIDHDNGL